MLLGVLLLPSQRHPDHEWLQSCAVISNNAICASLQYDIDVVAATRYPLATTGVFDRTAFVILIKIPPKFVLGDPAYVCSHYWLGCRSVPPSLRPLPEPM